MAPVIASTRQIRVARRSGDPPARTQPLPVRPPDSETVVLSRDGIEARVASPGGR
jgi:hypothetical protein